MPPPPRLPSKDRETPRHRDSDRHRSGDREKDSVDKRRDSRDRDRERERDRDRDKDRYVVTVRDLLSWVVTAANVSNALCNSDA